MAAIFFRAVQGGVVGKGLSTCTTKGDCRNLSSIYG